MKASTTCLLALWVCGQGAVGFENKFLFPVDNGLTFYYMNTIEVQYQSNFTNPTLYTFCKEGENGEAKQQDKMSAPKGNDTVSVKLDFTQGDICWFNLREDEKKGKLGFNSPHEWSFDGGKKNTTTVEALTTTSEPSSTTSTASAISTSASTTKTTTATASSTPTSSAVPVPDTAAASGVKIGIGVGIGLAGLLVMTVIGMVVARVLRKKKSNVEEYGATSEISLTGAHKPASVVSYNPVSQFEPSGGTLSAPYDPYRQGRV